MHKIHNQKLRPFLICFLLLTIIFVVLYNPFIFDGQMYAYEDIGSDTIHQYLPDYTVKTDILREGNADGYYLQVGLGKYVSGLLTFFLNPSNFALLLFGSEKLHVGLLVATYVKYVLICLFSLLYFLRVFKSEKPAMVSALLWTFSSYNVLWGQHYHFLTVMAGFSACMYGFQLYLEEDRYWYVAVPTLALLVGCNYYFTYMSAWFLIVYGILYLLFQKKGCLFILKKVGLFALLALLAACISAAYLFSAVTSFFSSNRVSQVESAISTTEMFYPIATILAFVARFFSTDLIGTANAFAGPVNYYEAAMLSVSFLFVYSVVFLLQGKHRWRVLGILVGCTVLLCTPFTSQFLVFTADTQRWTFLLCFLQALTIGLALTEYLTQDKNTKVNKRGLIAIIAGDGVLAILGLTLIFYHYHVGGGWLNKSSCLTVVVILLLYHIAFLLLWKSDRKFGVLLGMIVVELILNNYATVNNRDTITVEQWYTQMYNDGTQEVVEWIKEQDDSVYRINKTYYSVYKTDSMVQGYNGMGSYSSTNSGYLVNLAKNWGYQDAGNWVGFDGTDWLANDMLGVKYIISRSEEQLDSAAMERIYDDGTFCVYKNLDWSGFGYLCFEQMPESALEGLSRGQQAFLLTHYYYQTGDDDTPPVEMAQSYTVDLLPYFVEAYDCQITETEEGIVISNTGIDSQLHFTVPEIENGFLMGFEVEMSTQTSSNLQIFTAAQGAGYTAKQCVSAGYDSGEVTLFLENSTSELASLRVDPTMVEGQTLTLRAIKLVFMDAEQLEHQQTLQRENAVTDLKQDGNTFTGAITNPTDGEAMLCVPLIYSESWKASLDGEDVEVFNINGGLTGFKIPAGDHTFTLSYDNTVYTVGKAISWCAIAVYCVLVVWWHRGSKKQRKYLM